MKQSNGELNLKAEYLWKIGNISVLQKIVKNVE
jgi:hypothetical protein